MEGVSNCIDDTWCNKDVIYKSVLTEWKYKVISKVDGKIGILSTKNTSLKYYKNVFQQKLSENANNGCPYIFN